MRGLPSKKLQRREFMRKSIFISVISDYVVYYLDSAICYRSTIYITGKKQSIVFVIRQPPSPIQTENPLSCPELVEGAADLESALLQFQ